MPRKQLDSSILDTKYLNKTEIKLYLLNNWIDKLDVEDINIIAENIYNMNWKKVNYLNRKKYKLYNRRYKEKIQSL